MPRGSAPTIQEIRVRAVRVPMTEPHRTASGVIAESPLVLTDVLTDAGASGHSMVFTYTPAALKPTAELIRNFEALVKGEALAPAAIEQELAKRFRLLGTQGLVGVALAAIDMALWDALARVHRLTLVRLLGGAEKPLRAYGAVGYDGVDGCAGAQQVSRRLPGSRSDFQDDARGLSCRFLAQRIGETTFAPQMGIPLIEGCKARMKDRSRLIVLLSHQSPLSVWATEAAQARLSDASLFRDHPPRGSCAQR